MAKRQKSKRLPPIPVFAPAGEKRYHLRRLDYLLDFINADIRAMRTGDFLKLFGDFLDFFYGDIVTDESVFRKWCVDTDVDRGQLQLAQDISKELILRLKSERGWQDLPVILPIEYEACVENDGRLVLKRGNTLKEYSDPSERFKISSGLIIYPTIESQGEFSHFGDPRFTETIRHGVLTLLAKIHFDSVRCCPDCFIFFKCTPKKSSPLCRSCQNKKSVYTWRKNEVNRLVYNLYQQRVREGKNISLQQARSEVEKRQQNRGKNDTVKEEENG